MIKLKHIYKSYSLGDEQVDVLHDINLHVKPKEFVSILGPSGSGKSTLMNAYFDVMTGKFANGAAPTNICPVDENGEEKPVKEIERAITLEINGIEHEIGKVTKRKSVSYTHLTLPTIRLV